MTWWERERKLADYESRVSITVEDAQTIRDLCALVAAADDGTIDWPTSRYLSDNAHDGARILTATLERAGVPEKATAAS